MANNAFTAPAPGPGTNMGESAPRVDGRLKVTGAARYPSDTPVASPAYAVMATSAIAKGRIERLDIDDARAVPGVLDILTSENTGELKPAKFGSSSSTSIQTLGPDVAHAGQIIAVVVADTFEAASEAAHRVRVSYSEAKPAATFGADGLTIEDAAKASGRRKLIRKQAKRQQQSRPPMLDTTPNIPRRRNIIIRSSYSVRPVSGRVMNSPCMSRASSFTD